MREVAVIGIGMTNFGEIWGASLRDLAVEAGFKAIKDANITSKDIEAIYGGNMCAGEFISQEHIGALIADASGLYSNHIPATRIECGCASGGAAIRQGYLAVASGIHDIVIVGGVEKMTDVSAEMLNFALSTSADQEWESFFGATQVSLFAMLAKRHMYEYKTTREQLAAVAVKNHYNGSLNPLAQYRKSITIDTVLKSPMVAEPLTVFDCSPASDGAAAVILCSLEKAKKYTDKLVKIIASTQSSDTLTLANRRDICTMDAVVDASRKAYKIANKTQNDIDVVELHDNYTISEIIEIEDLGFAKKGDGGKFVEEGKTKIDSEIPINPSGGLKAMGNPLGASGVAQVVEIVTQLRGKAEKRQIKDAKLGLTLNIGGTGSTAVVHIFEVV